MKGNDIHTGIVIHLTGTESTMVDCKQILADINPPPDSFLVIADRQTSGQSRLNKDWISPIGGLWFTYCFQAVDAPSQFALAVGLSLHNSLVELFPDLHGRLLLKWPNDLILDGGKLSGILVQVQGGYICIGIGINTNNECFALNGKFQPASIKQSLGFEVSHKAILNSFLKQLRNTYQVFTQYGLKQFQTVINANMWRINQSIYFDNGIDIVTGICAGISDDGALLILSEQGETLSYYSGSVICTGN